MAFLFTTDKQHFYGEQEMLFLILRSILQNRNFADQNHEKVEKCLKF